MWDRRSAAAFKAPSQGERDHLTPPPPIWPLPLPLAHLLEPPPPPFLNTQPPPIPPLSKSPEAAWSWPLPSNPTVCLSADPCLGTSDRKNSRESEGEVEKNGRIKINKSVRAMQSSRTSRDKHLLTAFPLTLDCNQSSLLSDTLSRLFPRSHPLAGFFKCARVGLCRYWPSQPSAWRAIPLLPATLPTPPPFTDTQLPVLSYLEQQDRGQGMKRTREREKNNNQTKAAESCIKDGLWASEHLSLQIVFSTVAGLNNWLLKQLSLAYLQCQTKCL